MDTPFRSLSSLHPRARTRRAGHPCFASFIPIGTWICRAVVDVFLIALLLYRFMGPSSPRWLECARGRSNVLVSAAFCLSVSTRSRNVHRCFAPDARPEAFPAALWRREAQKRSTGVYGC
ncbi:hypothetical protein PYCCODRAFT_1044651 [Trametes coccinea BRFM310]|uniref:Uncharacterized protein n=1 Tax=Trametes coccinea (strain BRFM310) TaxID=1353009 RepID=A0A1Y2IA96_TRAC3|nr:hypothetical protein PYCCODRAFT_1044651 [Trametes coccinea BRFM310]